jgi:membrane protein required for colicin V production
MNGVDYLIIVIMVLSSLMSLLRGFARESLSLVAWVAAFWIAIHFCEALSAYFTHSISTPAIRVAVAFVVLLVATLLVAGIVNMLVAQLIDKTGLSGTDRLLGCVFGAARGVFIVTILILVMGLTPLVQTSLWQKSKLMPEFRGFVIWAQDMLPNNVAKHFVVP